MVKVRIATLKDLDEILDLEKRNGEPTKEDLRALFALKNPNEKCFFFVAEENDRIVGYSRIHFYRWNNSAYVITVLVDSRYRRRGVGTALLKAMEAFSKKNKARVIMFDTAIDNTPALQLYFKNGYRICGCNDKIYHNGKVALYLAKELRQK